MEDASTEASRSLVERYIVTLNNEKKTPELVRRFASDEALVEHVVAFESAFGGYKLLVDDVIADGDKVAVRFHTWQRHSGDFMGIKPTGKEFSLTGIIIYRIENGLIAEHWLSFDSGVLMQHVRSAPVQEAYPIS
ncbi:MAG TPA: ester cyclase [Trueperaceae bacterium]